MLFWESGAQTIAVRYFFLSSTRKPGLLSETGALQQEGILRAKNWGSGQDQSSGGKCCCRDEWYKQQVSEQVECWKSEALSRRETSMEGKRGVQEGNDRAFLV